MDQIIYYLFVTLMIAAVGFILYKAIRVRYKPHYKDKEAWQSIASYKKDEVGYSVILIGDTGAPSILKKDPVLHILDNHLKEAGKNCAVAVLGDLIYPVGLPPDGHRKRSVAEKRLNLQLDLYKKHDCRNFFISGNHDWNFGRSNGYEYAARLEKYIVEYLGDPESYQPKNDCPGPVEIPLTDEITLIILHTQLWVQDGPTALNTPGHCDAGSEDEFFEKLDEILKRTEGKFRIIAAHHPLYTNGNHGGKFPLKHHIFPLTDANKKLYIPFPVIGSLYPTYRKYIGAKEDMAHPIYRKLRKKLLKTIEGHANIVYAAGHDHNLQYFIKNKSHHHIVSGSACKTTYVGKGSGALFTHAHLGFFKVVFLKNKKIRIEAWEPDGKNNLGRLSFQVEINHGQNVKKTGNQGAAKGELK